MLTQDLIITVFLDPAVATQGLTAFATQDLIALRLPNGHTEALLTNEGDHLRLSPPMPCDARPLTKILPNRIALLALITLLDDANEVPSGKTTTDQDHWLTTHLHHLKVIPALLWLATSNRHVHLIVTPQAKQPQLRIKLAYHPTKNAWFAYTVRNTTLTPFKTDNCPGGPSTPPTDLPSLRAFVEHHLTLQFLVPLNQGPTTPPWLIILKDQQLLTHDWFLTPSCPTSNP